MRVIIIKPGQPPLLRRALDHLIKGLMLDRANRAALEDREAATAAVDQAVALKQHIGELDEDVGAALVIGKGAHFPGLMQIDRACEELFGIDGTPAILADAIQAHTVTLAIALAAAAHVGGKAEALVDAAKEVLEELGEDEPALKNCPGLEDLRRGLDELEATAEPSTFGQPQMDEAIRRMKQWSPGVASWVATVLSLRDQSATIEKLRAAGDAVADALDEAIPNHIYDFGNGDEQPDDCGYQKAVDDWRTLTRGDFVEESN